MKNLLLTTTMLLATGAVMAQLYVAPNTSTSTDSYVYVNDNVLFVEQDVNLVANTNDPTTEASIYLRNGSQLIQGNTGTYNTGTGTLSVYQDSFSDAYDYNFWCSPVGNAVGTAANTNSGISRFNDIIDVTESTPAVAWNYFNGESSPLRISTRWLYSWDAATQRWFANGPGNVTPGAGFTMKGTDVTINTDPYADTQNQNYDFRGRPNTGDITLPVQTAAGVPFTDGIEYNFTFAGNPYPSALDLNQVFLDADNIEIESFRFWDEDRTVNSHQYVDNKGGYGTWIPGLTPYVDGGLYTMPTFLNYDADGNPTGSTGVMGDMVERLFAPIGQGFMIKAAPIVGEDGFITIKNSHRAFVREGAGNSSEFKRPDRVEFDDDGNVIVVENTATPKLRIHTVFGGNSHYRDMLLVFSDQSTDFFDRGLDASHPMDGTLAEAYFTIGDTQENFQNLVIQTIPFADDKMVPIAFQLDSQMSVEVRAVEQINTPFVSAWLFDSLNNTYSEITDDGSVINPTGAQLTLDAGTYEERFFITFRSRRPPHDDEIDLARAAEKVEFFQNNPSAQLEVGNPEGYNIKKVQIFDMTGKLVLTQENLGTVNKLTFPTANLSDGTYLVKLNTADNLNVDYKISVFNK